jgi:hypothetical protein
MSLQKPMPALKKFFRSALLLSFCFILITYVFGLNRLSKDHQILIEEKIGSDRDVSTVLGDIKKIKVRTVQAHRSSGDSNPAYIRYILTIVGEEKSARAVVTVYQSSSNREFVKIDNIDLH